MTQFFAALALLALLAGLGLGWACKAGAPPAAPVADSYERMSEQIVSDYLGWRPQLAVSLGLHEYDGKTSDLRRDSLDRERERLRVHRDALRRVAAQSLPPELDLERRALLAGIEGALEPFELGAYSRNPMTYTTAFDVTPYAQRDFAPLAQRLRSTAEVLERVPGTLAAGRANLDEQLPGVFIDTAIAQANDSAAFFSGDLVKAFESVQDAALQARFAAARSAAAEAMTSFARWLEAERRPRARPDFAIGRDAYVRMLRDTELFAQSPEQVLEIGMRELEREKARFEATAGELGRRAPIRQVYQSIQRDHPTEQSLIPETRQHLEDIRRFIAERKLVSLPTDVRVRVEETPRFERADSFASMDSPGPFESKATEAFYYVTPPEPEWDAKRKEEWLTSFNRYATDITSIHEAYPGHYVQAQHLKASAASKIGKIFSSYAFSEGWAHYTEQMLVDEGFPADADAATRNKYRLEQSAEGLLRVCRLIASVKMHTAGMSVDQATRLFMDECYLEEAPARSEANRGTYDPGYGFYTLGKLAILKLRDDYRKQEGAAFSLLRFHDALLDHGQPPLRILREILLKDPAQWDAAL